MAKKLFVGNLPYSVTNEKLTELFSPFGTLLSANVIIDKFSGRSKGFGFVELEDAAADEAAKSLNETEIEGRKIVVNEARPMTERPPRREGGFGGGFRGGFQRRDRDE